MSLSDKRTLYDLCRKYKYYYNAYQEVKHLKEIYWSKYIKEAYDEVTNELKKVEDDIIYVIFRDLLGDYPKIEVERVFDDRFCADYRCLPKVVGEKVSIDNERFNNKVKECVERTFRERNGYEM